MIETHHLDLQTKGTDDIIRITDEVQRVLAKSGVREGSVLLFLQSTTASIAIIEDEEGLLSDFKSAMERLVPRDLEYEHEKAWHDRNGHSHIRATIMGQSLTIPISDSSMLLGRWQQLVLTEFDVRPRKRTVIVQIQGD